VKIHRNIVAVLILLAGVYSNIANAKTEVTDYKFISQKNNTVSLEVNINYDGKYGEKVFLSSRVAAPDTLNNAKALSLLVWISKGKNTIKVELPRLKNIDFEHQTNQIIFKIFQAKVQQNDIYNVPIAKQLIYQKKVKLALKWPSQSQMILENASDSDISLLYNEAVRYLNKPDKNTSGLAKAKLEKILLTKPDYVPAMIEMARYYMQSNWSKFGRLKAERMLDQAMLTDDQDPNVYILLGYVYMHQQKYTQAQKMFVAANDMKNDNPWLYVNWGQLYKTQAKYHLALEQLEKAVRLKHLPWQYAHAQHHAFVHIIQILKKQQDWDYLDDVYIRRDHVLADQPCYRIDHANYLLTHHGCIRQSN